MGRLRHLYLCGNFHWGAERDRRRYDTYAHYLRRRLPGKAALDIDRHAYPQRTVYHTGKLPYRMGCYSAPAYPVLFLQEEKAKRKVESLSLIPSL